MITLTETAAMKVKVQLMNRDHGYGIRVGVRTTGCSGLAYLLEYVDKVDPNDLCYWTNGVNVYVNPQHLPYLEGLVMDWKREGLNEGFAFENPNVKGECGCGESFSV
jgi:iron-sulfur cluster assembly protein